MLVSVGGFSVIGFSVFEYMFGWRLHMAKNANLTAAKKAKNDEFYTQITDIEKVQ